LVVASDRGTDRRERLRGEYGNRVASFDEVPGSEPVDPDYADLFREGDAAPSVSSLPTAAEEPAPPPASPAAPPVDPHIDTGRLFRSQGVQGNDAAVLALASDRGGRLRTLVRSDAAPSTASPAVPRAGALDSAVVGPVSPFGASAPEIPETEAPPASAAPTERRAVRSRGIPARAVYILIIGVTLLVAFVNALVASGGIGWPTGAAMLAVTIYCALKVRREDDLVVIITPPIAFFVAAITAAQVFIGSAERSLLNRAVVAFFTLADNWIWIIGTTLVALVIVVVRRRG
jgi:hypothetical protein